MERARIVIFVWSLGTGGTERQMAQLADRLGQSDWAVTVVAVYPGGQYWDWLEGRGNARMVPLFQSRHKGKLRGGIQIAWAAWRLRKWLASNPAAVVYSTLHAANFVAWLAVRGNSDVKLVWGNRASEHRFGFRHALPFYLCKKVSSTVPLLISNSQAGLKHSESQGFRTRSSAVIPNGIDTAYFHPDAEAGGLVRTAWGADSSRKLVGLVGRLTPVKDHPNFLKAAGSLVRRRGDLIFVVVGSGSGRYESLLYSLAEKLGLNDRIIWAGSRSDIPDVYNALDILVCCSTSEGFPNVVGEAMACGVPCVVTDVGDSARIVEDTGVVIAPHSPDEIAAGIERLLKKLAEDGEPLAARTRQRIAQNFSLEKLCHDTGEALRSAM